jgi:hypothetical protein
MDADKKCERGPNFNGFLKIFEESQMLRFGAIIETKLPKLRNPRPLTKNAGRMGIPWCE